VVSTTRHGTKRCFGCAGCAGCAPAAFESGGVDAVGGTAALAEKHDGEGFQASTRFVSLVSEGEYRLLVAK